MTKQQVIDILEAYKPSGNIYNGYNSIEEKIDERICYLIDEIIGRVKQEPDNEWIKCSEQMPDYGKEVLVCDATYGNVFNAVLCRKRDEDGDNWFTDCDYINYKAFTHWMPLPSTEGLDDAT